MLGRLVLPIGTRFEQVITLVRRTEDGFTQEPVEPAVFVPLLGERLSQHRDIRRSARHHHPMTRVTIDLDGAVLRELKNLQKREGKTLGELISELLASALAEEEQPKPREFQWISKDMEPLVDLEDKEAVRLALER